MRMQLLLASATGCLAAVVACNGNGDLFVKGVLAPPPLDIHSTAACVYAADGASPLVSAGLVDVALAGNYTPTLLIGNTGGHRVALDGATVRLTDSSGNQLKAFDTVAAGSLDPGSSSSPSYAAFAFRLVDASTLATMGARAGPNKVRILAFVTIHGTTSGGEIHAPELVFPVDVCRGCLVTFPPDAQDPTKPAPNCAAPLPASGTMPCVLGQDQAVDCRLCQGNPACAR